MYFYENNYFKDVTEITKRYKLVSASEIMKLCNCNRNGFIELIKERGIKPEIIRLEPSGKTYTLYKRSDLKN